MNYSLNVLLSFSILVPALIGWSRFFRISPAYYPFLYCVTIGSFNEIISFLLTQNGHQNVINNNTYSLIESLLIAWQFRKWKAFEATPRLYFLIITTFIAGWVIEHFVIHNIYYSTSYFRVYYSFIIVLLSINLINRLIAQDRLNILKNPIFLICIAFVIFYTYYVLIMAFWYYGLNFSEPFLIKVGIVMPYVNFLSNILFGFAFLWIHTKQRFSLPSL